MAHITNKFFRHYKGNFYYVLGLSTHTETEDTLVNYMSLYSTLGYRWGRVWSRPLTMWLEEVNGVPRFVECVPDKELLDKTLEYLKKNEIKYTS